MRMFVFSMRTFDELPCFEKYCPKYGIEYDYTTETPCMDNLELAKGYDVVNVITTVFDQPMLKKLHDMGVKCIATEQSVTITLTWTMRKALAWESSISVTLPTVWLTTRL